MSNQEDQFEGMNEVKSQTPKWGKVGDWFRGTLIANSRVTDSTYAGKRKKQRVFEFLAKGGSFHGINEDKTIATDPTVIEAGGTWSLFAEIDVDGVAGKESVFASQLSKAKIGQDVGVKFTEEVPSKTPGLANAKIKKVFLGKIDPSYSNGGNDHMFDQ